MSSKTLKYILKRIGLAVLTVWVVITVTFFVMHAVPGGPFMGEKAISAAAQAALEAKYGLDKPLLEQYTTYLRDIVTRFDFGPSLKQRGRQVVDVIADGMRTSAPLGIIAATKQYTKTDYTITIVALACFSLPTFFFASLLKLVFCVHLGWFDLGGLIGRNYEYLSPAGQLLDKANHLVLPIVTLVVISIGSLMRYTRTNMLEVLNADYIRTARAKGLPENKVIYHHAFRNTLIPLVTMLGGSLPGLFAGALITETLYSIPGIGFVSYQSMVAGDIPFSMFYLVFMAILTLLGNLISDILYAVVDPRVRIA
jgi:peptide/nickel transport system permease protein